MFLFFNLLPLRYVSIWNHTMHLLLTCMNLFLSLLIMKLSYNQNVLNRFADDIVKSKYYYNLILRMGQLNILNLFRNQNLNHMENPYYPSQVVAFDLPYTIQLHLLKLQLPSRCQLWLCDFLFLLLYVKIYVRFRCKLLSVKILCDAFDETMTRKDIFFPKKVTYLTYVIDIKYFSYVIT